MNESKNLFVICAVCGCGKSTVKDYLEKYSKLKNFVFMDSDEVGLNWHDYKDFPDANERFVYDSLKIAIKKSENKNIVWATCMNPKTYYEDLSKLEEIEKTFFINLTCSDDEITKRLKGRPKFRMTHSDEFIESQINYMSWFKDNADKMDLVIDTTNQTISETAELIEKFIILQN